MVLPSWLLIILLVYGLYFLAITYYLLSRILRSNRLHRLDSATREKYSPFIP